MAVIRGADGLEVIIVLDPRASHIPIPECENRADSAARGQLHVKKYIESKSDCDFGIHVRFDQHFIWTEDTHFRIDILCDGELLCSDDVSSEKIQNGFDNTYLKANKGENKEDFYFSPLALRKEALPLLCGIVICADTGIQILGENGDEASDTDFGIITVQFHPLIIAGFKTAKARSHIGLNDDRTLASKPYIADFRKRPSHRCT